MPKLHKPKANCRECGAEFEPEYFDMGYGEEVSFQFCSDECHETFVLAAAEFEAERNEFDRKKEALRRWEAIVPISMRETDLDRLPNIKQYIDWQPDDTGMGLTIIGKTGAGKTRLTYLILRNLMVELGLTVTYFRPGDFAIKSHSAWMNNRSEQFYKELMDVDILILDDLGKERFTETRMMDFFSMVNNRPLRSRLPF